MQQQKEREHSMIREPENPGKLFNYYPASVVKHPSQFKDQRPG